MAESTLPPTQVRTAVERGPILWADAYLDSDSALFTPIDPRLLEPAPPEPRPNRATRRKNRRGKR